MTLYLTITNFYRRRHIRWQTDEINEQCTEINNIIKSYDKSSMFIGEAPATKDLIDITDHDFRVVSAVSIGAIFLLIFFVLKSITLPIILCCSS